MDDSMTDWLKLIEIPSMVLAAGVIWMLFVILKALMAELKSYNTTLTKISVVLDILCRKIKPQIDKDTK